MHATLGAGLLLVSTMLVGLSVTPAQAAAACAAPDTTWLGPNVEGGSTSWTEPTNWSDGVPTATSAVCIPATTQTPHVLVNTTAVADVIDATASGVVLDGTLTVNTRMDIASLDFPVETTWQTGFLQGPGTTEVVGSLTGDVKLDRGAVVDQYGTASLEGDEINVQGNSTLRVHGAVSLGDVVALVDDDSEFVVEESGTLSFGRSGTDHAGTIMGPFVNHGRVDVSSGFLIIEGADFVAGPNSVGLGSTGDFTAAPDAELWLTWATLLEGAELTGVYADQLTIPAGNTVHASGTTLQPPIVWTRSDRAVTGAGELVLTDDSTVADGAGFGGQLTVRVPAGETLHGAGTVSGDARLVVEGELRQREGEDLEVLDDAIVDVWGTYRTSLGGDGGGGPDDWGLIRIRPGGELVQTALETPNERGPGTQLQGLVANHGTVSVQNGWLGMVLSGAEEPSTGSFTSSSPLPVDFAFGGYPEDAPVMVLGPGSTVSAGVLSSDTLVADGATLGASWKVDDWPDTQAVEGELLVTGGTTLTDGASLWGPGDVVLDGVVSDPGTAGTATAEGAEVAGPLMAASGVIRLTGTTVLRSGAAVTKTAGSLLIDDDLVSDPGVGGTATLSGAQVDASVSADSGMLLVPNLAPKTLLDGVLSGGTWSVAPGATLDLPTITRTDVDLTLEGPGASFGADFGSFRATGPDGSLALLAGADLSVAERFRNAGDLLLSSGSRLDVATRFRQLGTGALVVLVDAAGIGRVRAAGRRDLAGDLVVDRDPAYQPVVGTTRTFLTSDARVSSDDRFDRVFSPRYDSRKLRPLYKVNRVRLRVVRVG